MLKLRIIPIVLFNGQVVVKSIKFDPSRNIGHPVNIARIYNAREVDELIFIDINATKDKRKTNLEIVYDIAEESYMPLTVGGGINSLDDIRNILNAGADKVAINSAIFDTPALLTNASKRFGAQCIVVCIDAISEKNSYKVYKHYSRELSRIDAVDWARKLEDLGAGEILLTSVDRDGTMSGYDTEIITMVSEAVSIPVIAAGGVGELSDFFSGAKAGASALAASSIFHFTQHTPLDAKKLLASKGVEVRL